MTESALHASPTSRQSQTIKRVQKGKADVVVVGGGVVGCFTAYELAKRGCQVTLVERQTLGSGASSGSCGYICPSHVIPLCAPGAIRQNLPALISQHGAVSIPPRFDPPLWKWLFHFACRCSVDHAAGASIARDGLLKRSTVLYRDLLENQPIECQWTRRGLLLVHRGQKSLDDYAPVAKDLLEQYGVRSNRLDEQEIVSFEPALVDGLAGGWWFPDDSHLHPGELLSQLTNVLQALNVHILEGVQVNDWIIEANRIKALRSPAGNIEAEQFVLTTGAETPILARLLDCRLPIVPGKGYSMDFEMPSETLRVPMIFEDSHVALTPFANQLRVGSTMQLTGYDRTLNQHRLTAIADDARSYLRVKLPEHPQRQWAGWRPMMADDVPVMDQACNIDNAWIAAGNGMIGISTAPATGEMIAQRIVGEATTLPSQPFSLARFRSGRNRQRLPTNTTL